MLANWCPPDINFGLWLNLRVYREEKEIQWTHIHLHSVSEVANPFSNVHLSIGIEFHNSS